MIIKGVHNVKRGPLPDKKVFSLISSHHKRREAKRIIKGGKFCLFSSKELSAPERSLTMKKGMHCLSIIRKNH